MVDPSPTMWDTSHEGVLGWLFVEFPEFSRWWRHYFGTDERLAGYQSHLARQPDSGEVIPGCGGLRKDRWPDPRRGKGKRGGLRIIYLLIPEVRVIVLVDLYDKDEAIDLTPSEKKLLTRLARQVREELIGRLGKDPRT